MAEIIAVTSSIPSKPVKWLTRVERRQIAAARVPPFPPELQFLQELACRHIVRNAGDSMVNNLGSNEVAATLVTQFKEGCTGVGSVESDFGK